MYRSIVADSTVASSGDPFPVTVTSVSFLQEKSAINKKEARIKFFMGDSTTVKITEYSEK